MSSGGLLNNGESIGIGVFGVTGDSGGDEDIGVGVSDDEAQDDVEKNEEDVIDNGERGVDEHVDNESFLVL